MEQILLIDKPAGISSFGVVAKVRKKLSQELGVKKLKVGHTGTLDPFATGLLILLVGKATKKSNDFLKLDKEYIAEIKLGETSTTGDPEGIVQKTYSGPAPSPETIKKITQNFVGEITQKVPAFSAVKINGQRAYKLARQGQTIDTPTRKIHIYNIEILNYTWPTLKIKTQVSSGTYIRTLGEDIGRSLGTGAYLTSLRRTKIANYSVKKSITLEKYLKSH